MNFKKQPKTQHNPHLPKQGKYNESLNIVRLMDTPISMREGKVEYHGDNNIVPIEYIQNKYGFRSPEFNNQPLMALGCSNTYGIGLPENFTWPHTLGKNLNMDYINLGLPGDSVMGQVRNAFWYFKNFGHPEIIVGIFPITRMQIPHVEGLAESLHEAGNAPKAQYGTIPLYIYEEELTEYSRMPYKYEQVLPRQVTAYMSNVFISMLDQYCRANGIKFIWSYWEGGNPTFQLFTEYSAILYDSYTKLKAFDFILNNDDEELSAEFIGPLQCHQEFKHHPLFHRAADRQGPNRQSHWGIHTNIHLAGELTKKINKLLTTTDNV